MKRWAALFAVGSLTIGLSMSGALANELRDSLDSSLMSGDMQQVVSVMRGHKDPADQAEIADWLKEKVDTGQAPDQFAMSMIVISLKNGKIDDALMYLSYYRSLIIIDSSICGNSSSGGSLLEATIFLFSKIGSDKSITLEQRRNAVGRAIAMEAATSSVRKKDPSLCGAGLSAYAKDLHVTSPQSTDRNTQESLAAAPSLYNDNPQWRKNREGGLPKLKSILLALIGAQEAQ